MILPIVSIARNLEFLYAEHQDYYRRVDVLLEYERMSRNNHPLHAQAVLVSAFP